MTDYILERLLLLSLAGTLFFAVLSVVFLMTRKLFDSRWRYGMCIAALLIFITPLAVKIPDTSDGTANEINALFIMTITQTESSEDTEKDETAVPSVDYQKLCRISFAIWLTGCVFYLSFTAVCYIIYRHRLSKNAWEFDCSKLTSRLGFKKLTVYKTSGTSSPVLAGLIKQALFLPDINLSERDISNIIRHEATHKKRFDTEIKWLCVLAKSVHWFNPAIFLLSKKLDTECEISCDLLATKNLDKDGTREYCDTILSLISASKTVPSPVLCLKGTKKTLKRRFLAIMHEKNKSKKTLLVSVILAAVLLLCAVTASAMLGGSVETKSEPAATLTTIETDKAQQSTPEAYNNITSFDTTNIHMQGAKISAAFDKDRHPAVDFIIARDTVITCPAEGTVTMAEYTPDKGNVIEITLTGGTSKILFAHLSQMYVEKGDKVIVGDSLGTVGATGRATGPHLHVEYYENDTVMNPAGILIIQESGEISAAHSTPTLIEDDK